MGLARGVTGRVRIAQFNDVDGLAAALELGDVAMVLTEPAMINRIHSSRQSQAGMRLCAP